MNNLIIATILSSTLISHAFAAEVAVVTGKVQTNNAEQAIDIDPILLTAPEGDTTFRFKLVATRTLNDFTLTGKAITSDKYWPKLSIECDGVAKDISTSFVVPPVTKLRLASEADVTGCKTVRIVKPAEIEAVKYNAATSFINYYLVGGDLGE